jgi:hypothetical protein
MKHAFKPRRTLIAAAVAMALSAPAMAQQLVIDQRPDFEPANTKLDLGGLDDIELVIEHESYTLQ